MKIASHRLPTSRPLHLSAARAFCGESPRPFRIKNLQIPLSRLSTHIDFYFMYFQAFTNPFSTNPFLFTSIQNPRGVHSPCAEPSDLPETPRMGIRVGQPFLAVLRRSPIHPTLSSCGGAMISKPTLPCKARLAASRLRLRTSNLCGPKWSIIPAPASAARLRGRSL